MTWKWSVAILKGKNNREVHEKKIVNKKKEASDKENKHTDKLYIAKIYMSLMVH